MESASWVKTTALNGHLIHFNFIPYEVIGIFSSQADTLRACRYLQNLIDLAINIASYVSFTCFVPQFWSHRPILLSFAAHPFYNLRGGSSQRIHSSQTPTFAFVSFTAMTTPTSVRFGVCSLPSTTTRQTSAGNTYTL